jgi:protein gp37
MTKTKIEWADATWNPVTGCTKVSPGCQNCYAERMAKRLAGRCGYPAEEPFKVTVHPDKLEEPLKWKMPRRVFVCSMSDLFHEDVSESWIYEIFRVMERCPQHTFMVLTKRPERMRQMARGVVTGWETEHRKHIWLGVTTENQEQTNKRIPILLDTPAAVRYVSVEPMLGPVDLDNIQADKYTNINALEGCGISWVICGSESGPKARPMQREWAFNLMQQCKAVGVPFFYKQGPDDNGFISKMPVLDGRVWAEYPAC